MVGRWGSPEGGLLVFLDLEVFTRETPKSSALQRLVFVPVQAKMKR